MNQKIKTKDITTCALMAAIMCILCPISIPIGPIPISLQIFVFLLSAYILGTKYSLISFLVYLILGAAGLPVFSGFQGGLGKLVGPTGGYIVGFAFTVLIAGIIIEKTNRKPVFAFIGMLLGTVAAYFLGTVWFIIQAKCEIGYALSVCVIPFIPFDLAKMIVAIWIGIPVRRALEKNNLIDH